MDAQAKSVSEVLNSGSQYLIPFFQRQYSWRQKHWKRLWQDITILLEAGDKARQHFLGPLVCTPDNPVPAPVTSYQLIDGQQRLTTLTLLLSALRNAALENDAKELAEQINEQYLIHKYQKGNKRYRVLPRVSDSEAFIASIEHKIEKEHKKFGVFKAQRFFRKRIDAWIETDPEAQLNAIFHAVSNRLSLVVITIDGENPYEIFESLNSTGLPLEEADLIRNFIFMQVPVEEQDEFNKQHWEPLEQVFGEGDQKRFNPTVFYRNYLMRDGVFSNAKMTFVDFKEQNKERGLRPDQQADELLRFAKLESMIRHPDESGRIDVADALRAVKLLEITTAHALLLNLLDRWQCDAMSTEDLLGCIKDLSSFVLRRSICGLSTRQYNRYFPEAAGEIRESPRNDLQAYWIKRGWPNDDQFTTPLTDFPIYHREAKKCRLLLQQIEDAAGHKEKVDYEGLTIEHVLPQRIDAAKGKAWRDVLGEDWFNVHSKWVHTIGNLTLTGYNPDMSNSPYEKKRPLLAKSHLVMNKQIASNDAWGIKQISERAQEIAQQASAFWPVPEGAGVKPPQPKKQTKGIARRLPFWERFADRLAASNFPLKPIAVGPTVDLNFEVGHPDIEFWAWIQQSKKELKAGMTFRRKSGRTLFEKLLAERSDIDAKLGADPEWHQGYRCWVTVARPDSRLKDEFDWEVQQEWLANRMRELYDTLGPLIMKHGESA